MAGISSAVVSNAKFRPFSYQEMLAPLAAYTQEYNTIQEGLSNLEDASNVYGEYLAGTEAGKTISEFNNQLKAAAEDMAKNGLGVTNRDTLYGLKRRYNNDILKINKAAQNLDTLYKQVQQDRLKDNSLMVGKMPTIDEMLQNPSATPTIASGNQMYAHAAKSAQAASARKFLNETQVGKGVMQYWVDNVVKSGYSPEELNKFAALTDSIPELRDAMDDIKTMYNVQNLSPEDQVRSDSFIMRGIMDGAGYQEQHKYMENPETRAALDWEYTQKKMDLQHQYNLDEMDHQAELKAADSGSGGTGADDGTSGVSTVSYFNGDSDTKAYNTLKSLQAKNGGLSASVFGKTYGKINPMSVYDQAEKAYQDAYNKVKNQSTGSSYSDFKSGDDASIYKEAAAARAGQAAKAKILNYYKTHYGISRLLTKDEYDSLGRLGYSSKMSAKQMFGGTSYGSGWLKNLGSKIDSKVKETSIYEVNGDEVNERLYNTIKNHAQTVLKNNSDATVIHELDSRGKTGDVVDDWGDVGDYDKSRLGYSWSSNQFILTNKGKRYAIDPSLISNEVRDLMRNRDRIYNQRLQYYEQQLGRKATSSEKSQIKSMLATEIANQVARMASNDIIQAKGQTSSKAD